MLFSTKRRRWRIKRSANNYKKKCCCVPKSTSTSPKDAKTVYEACRRFNSKRIK